MRLPDAAQKLIETCRTRADFFHTDEATAVYIDGPVHDQTDVAAEDQQVNERLTWEAGLAVIRFRCNADWTATREEYGRVFGKGDRR